MLLISNEFFLFLKNNLESIQDLRLEFFYYFSIIRNNNIDLVQNKIAILKNLK